VKTGVSQNQIAEVVMNLPRLFDQPLGLWENDPFFNRFFGEPRLRDVESSGTYLPACDLSETDKEYSLAMDLPGIKKEDIHISLSDGLLSVEAETSKTSEEKKGGKVIRRERQYGKFMRQFHLGDEVKDNEVHAKFKDGVLTLNVPKHEQQKLEARDISID